MNKQIELYDFVRPRVAPPQSIWRVIEIKGDVITAEKRANELEPKQIERVSATATFFYLLDEADENDKI